MNMNKATHLRHLRQQAEFNRLFLKGEPHSTKKKVTLKLIRELVKSAEYEISDPFIRCFVKWKVLTLSYFQDAISAKWNDIDMEKNIWTISDTGFSIPLSVHAQLVLTELRKFCGNSHWLFPGAGRNETIRPETIHRAVRQLGYADKLTVNDFRLTACRVMRDGKHHEELIKSVFFHHSDYPPASRSEIMNWWGQQFYTR